MLIIFYAMKDKRILIIIIASIALLIAALSAANGIRRGQSARADRERIYNGAYSGRVCRSRGMRSICLY